MRELTLLNSKGGTGKTTVAFSLAVRAARQGKRVAMLDTDQQRSLLQWGSRRKTEPFISVEAVPLSGLGRKLASLRRGDDVDLVLIDTHGSLNDLDPALTHATEIIVPVQPSGIDLVELGRVVALCARYKATTWLVVNRVKTKRERADIAPTLGGLTAGCPTGRAAKAMISDRVSHRSHFLEGLAAEEVGDAQAQAEIQALYEELEL